MVSIILPIYNRAHLIEETLNSIKSQIFKDWECIIVDDGSTDTTVKKVNLLIQDDNRFKLFERPNNIAKGPSACRNFGFTKIKGDYLQFFDSDDIMHPDHLNLKIKAIEKNDVVVCKLRAFSGAFNKSIFSEDDKSSNLVEPENLFEAFATGVFPMMMVAPLWKTSSIQSYFPIRDDMHILEDHELYARALFQKKSLAIINRELIYYRVGEQSSTNSFYSNVDYGLTSYFKAKNTVLKLSQSNPVKLSVLKMTLGFFRQALAERNFVAASKCLSFIKEKKLCYNFVLKLKYFRIHFFYIIFKVIRKGDTKFKPLFKL
ncbi:glycosyltransferase family 2 protein [Hyunsoonleella flava]|uniref:Glycosyltransferase family 2 protein n=1 Tax=Hyunsoonleella flava TaxID=2527939 RepID=A0A4Q9FGK5_9FLAO|nr:glycosyltransferase family 2 protein [Hyunsoonleella flava]TBN03594.1 glycosyltransferase family 2 protein [Hyunsoonleella flava]